MSAAATLLKCGACNEIQCARHDDTESSVVAAVKKFSACIYCGARQQLRAGFEIVQGGKTC